MATSYSKLTSVGWRQCGITASTDMGISGSFPAMVDGVNSSGTLYFNPNSQAVSGKYIRFQFEYPLVIDEAKWYQSATSSHGTWKWQGSNNGSSWTDIGSSFTLGGVATQTQTELNGNVTAYKYYQLLGVSGNASWSPYLREIEFKSDELVIPEGGAAYLTGLGAGDRTGTITLTENMGANVNVPTQIIDGTMNGETYFASGFAVSGYYYKFDLGTSYVFNEACWTQQGTAGLGTWRWQGSNNGSDWTNIGSSFTLGGASIQYHTELNGNTTAYRYYRLLGVSGNAATHYQYEIYFKTYTPITTTAPPTTLAPTTLAPTTLTPTTLAPTTISVTTGLIFTTLAPTTIAPTTLEPSTQAPTTLPSTTLAPTTLAPTTLPSTTLPPTTIAPTTLLPTTLPPSMGVLVGGKLINESILFGRLVQ